jgi:hypothetical protein
VWLALILCILLALPVSAQRPAAPTPATPSPETAFETLKILVLDGQNAINSIEDRTAVQPVVEVHDENDQPIEGVDVVFQLPTSGAGGAFTGNQLTAMMRTNNRGQAGALMTPNAIPGKFTIRVSASIRNRTGHAVITQTNALRAEATRAAKGGFKFRWWKVALIGGIAAGVVVGVVVATRGGSSSGSSTTITVTPGSPTFGAP